MSLWKSHNSKGTRREKFSRQERQGGKERATKTDDKEAEKACCSEDDDWECEGEAEEDWKATGEGDNR